jgi:hypothetical protein
MSQLLIEGKVDDRDLIIDGLRRRVAQLEEELQAERSKANSIDAGAQQLRGVLNPLYNALRRVYGQMDEMGIGQAELNHSNPKANLVWEDWKKKLGGAAARIIDILHLHGQLDQTQIRIHLGTNRIQTVYDAVSKLNKAGIINKNGGRISLKEL